jgi:hypothetical protein
MRGISKDHLVLMLKGYLLAATVAAFVTLCVHLLVETIALPSDERIGAPRPIGLILLPVITAVFAFPVWFFLVVFAETTSETRLPRFAVVGALAGFLAVAVVLIGAEGFNGTTIVSRAGLVAFISASMGGFVGGVIYWVIAGQHSGSWKETPALPDSQTASSEP